MNDIWSALADPTRRRILEMLKKDDMTAGEIASEFEISKPSMSHHLTILKNAGLVTSKKKGQNVIYSINTTVFQDVLVFMNEIAGKKTKDEDIEKVKAQESN